MREKIRLVVSDVDGTLLVEGTFDLNPEMYEVIRKLKEMGITFAAVSGRQYISLHKLFAPVDNDIVFVADNGACSLKNDELISCYSIEKEVLREIIYFVREMGNVFLLVSTPQGAYTESQDEELNDWIRNGYKINLKEVDDILAVEEPVVKVAVYTKEIDAETAAKPAYKEFEGKATVVVSGDRWIDFVANNVNKGAAVAALQKALGVSPEQTMAFGDNYNDIDMLLCANESYAVAGARTKVKELVKHVLTDASMDAVLNELKRVFQI